MSYLQHPVRNEATASLRHKWSKPQLYPSVGNASTLRQDCVAFLPNAFALFSAQGQRYPGEGSRQDFSFFPIIQHVAVGTI